MKVWSPGLKQLRDRDNKMLQNILDLTDWRGLHMSATPGSVHRSTEWAIEGRSQGSVFKVASTVSIHSTPSWSQLEEIKRFLANSLLLELKIIQISTEEGTSWGGTQCRVTFTIQVHNRHRATETARELREWLKSSLEGILVEEGLWKVGTGSTAQDTPRVFEVLGDPREESPELGEGDTVMRTRTVAEFLSAHFQEKWTEEAGGGLLPPPCIHPPRDLVKGGRDSWRRGLKDLIRWISWGRFHLYAGILSGGLLPESAGTPEEEAVLIESRKGELCVAAIETIEIGWSLLRGLGAPAEIMLAGPNPIPTDFDLEDFLTRTLDTLGTLNKWCEKCGGRFTAICPECTAGACWFCVRHRGDLCCEVCERETDISGDWIDGTRLVDDSLSLNYHDMGSFLISEVRGVRLTGIPSSDVPHDRLEFKDIVRGWQPEERQKWISELLENQGQGRECNDEVLIERLWSARNVRPMLLPTRW
jgi:hypothetical protein